MQEVTVNIQQSYYKYYDTSPFRVSPVLFEASVLGRAASRITVASTKEVDSELSHMWHFLTVPLN